MLPIAPFTLESAVHLIQVALTPVFLLSGIAALLTVYAGRLARVADRLDSLITTHETNGTEADAKTRDEISRLHRRSIVLDTAVVLGTAGAAATCLAIMTLFLLALSNKAIAGVLLTFFGAAIVCTLCSVAVFGLEMLLSSRGLRARMHVHLPAIPWRRRAH